MTLKPHWEIRVSDPKDEDGKRYFSAETEADARALMLIYLLKNNFITP